MPVACAGRKGRGSGSSSSRAHDAFDFRFRGALLKGLRVIGEEFDIEIPTVRDKCQILVDLYKECKTEELYNCIFYLEQRPKNCPKFNKGEFLRMLRATKSNSKDDSKS